MVTDREKKCAYAKKYREKNREKIIAKKKLYWLATKDRDREKRILRQREYNKNNKEKTKVSRKKWYDNFMSNEKNRIKRRVKAKAYRENNIEKARAYDRKYIKKPEIRVKRVEATKNWRHRNPRRSSAFSSIYYLCNKKKCDENHKEWNKKKVEKVNCSLWKYYKGEKHTPLILALARTFGRKGNFQSQQVKTIKKDINILQREITKQKELLKQW